MGKATQDLRKEHEAIIEVLQILDRMMQPGTLDIEKVLSYYGEVLFFLKIFVDQCHHGKEEKYLFEELARRGIPGDNGLVGDMLQDHAQGRALTGQMGRMLEMHDTQGFVLAAGQYRDLLRGHIDKENKVLFTMADQVISEHDQDRLFEQFEQHEENVIGHGVHEKLHAMIGTWATAFTGDE